MWKPVQINEMKASGDLGVVETIYEETNIVSSSSSSASEDLENVVMVMNMAYSVDGAVQNVTNLCRDAPCSSSSVGVSLKRNIWAWCEATGLPTSVTIHVENRSYKLHKYPLVSKSGYLKRNLSETLDITLATETDIFELVANFCYGSTIQMDPSNVAALRCAAEFLEMTEEYGRGNLCERTDVYFTKVVLQSWEDTLVVLQRCQSLLPLAEEILIVSRCIDSLAFMACMQVLDPEQGRARPAECQFWNGISFSSREWWTKDLISLPFVFFEGIVISMRKQGMEETVISRVIVQYGAKWILSDQQHDMTEMKERNASVNDLLEGIIRLLPIERYSVPVNFLFSLLHRSLNCNLSNEYKTGLEARIASQLELATMDDFLSPVLNANNPFDSNGIGFDAEVESMRRIVSIFMCQQSIMIDSCELHSSSSNSCSFQAISTVANLWDEYLAHIACDVRLNPNKFSELIDSLPSYARSTHDLLYKAAHRYLTAHPQLSQEERLSVCKFLNCQKLSQEACIHAVQNELMPLRLIVQAMFMQQLYTRQSIWSNSNSTLFEGNGNDSLNFLHKSLMDSSQSLQEEIRYRVNDNEDGLPLGFILKRDAAFRQAACLKAEFESTSFRLKNLEEELVAMKRNLEENKGSGKTRHVFSSGKSESFRVLSTSKPVDTKCRKGLGNTCIGTTNWFSQKESYGNLAQKLLKSFRRLSFWKSKNDQHKGVRDLDPCPQVEATMADIDQVEAPMADIDQCKEKPQSRHFHRRNYSFS